MDAQPFAPASTGTSSDRPILPQLAIFETDVSTFSPFTSTHTTPKNKDNDMSPQAVVRAHSSRRSAISAMSNLPSPKHGESLPRVRGTRLSGFDSDEVDENTNAESNPSWVGRQRDDVANLPEMAEREDVVRLGDFILRDLREAWWRNEAGAPGSHDDISGWGGLVAKGPGSRRPWREGEADTMGRMGLRKPEPKRESGSRSLLRFELGVDGGAVDMSTPSSSMPSLSSSISTTSSSAKYRASRFTEVLLDGADELVGERSEGGAQGNGGEGNGRGKGKEKKGSLRRKIWKDVKGLVGKRG